MSKEINAEECIPVVHENNKSYFYDCTNIILICFICCVLGIRPNCSGLVLVTHLGNE